jgi:hypothetical protein
MSHVFLDWRIIDTNVLEEVIYYRYILSVFAIIAFESKKLKCPLLEVEFFFLEIVQYLLVWYRTQYGIYKKK